VEIVFENERLWNGIIIPDDFSQSIIDILEEEKEEGKTLAQLDKEMGMYL
jgi:hypothetical protein